MVRGGEQGSVNSSGAGAKELRWAFKQSKARSRQQVSSNKQSVRHVAGFLVLEEAKSVNERG